jgi:uncharacterized membrane protein
MVGLGLLAAVGAAFTLGPIVAVIVGWAAASVSYVIWVWLVIGGLDAAATEAHATREDPSRAVADLLVVCASLASLGALVFLLVESQLTKGAGQGALAVLAVVSVALSWVLIHTLFTLRYASIYYWDEDGGINFNQTEPPRYTDFAYLAFTLGMTFQVSDTSLTNHRMRLAALRHALLSYLFGSVILATLINLVAGLSGSAG